jgi:hypothetical protein
MGQGPLSCFGFSSVVMRRSICAPSPWAGSGRCEGVGHRVHGFDCFSGSSDSVPSLRTFCFPWLSLAASPSRLDEPPPLDAMDEASTQRVLCALRPSAAARGGAPQCRREQPQQPEVFNLRSPAARAVSRQDRFQGGMALGCAAMPAAHPALEARPGEPASVARFP